MRRRFGCDSGGRSVTVAADQNRPDVGAAYPRLRGIPRLLGDAHQCPAGLDQVCVTVINRDSASATPSRLLRGRSVTDPLGRARAATSEASAGMLWRLHRLRCGP